MLVGIGGVTFDFYNRLIGMNSYDVVFIDKHKNTDEDKARVISEIKEIISQEFNEKSLI